MPSPGMFTLLVRLLVLSLAARALPDNIDALSAASVKFKAAPGPKKDNSYIVTYKHGIDKERSFQTFKATHPNIKVVQNYDQQTLNGFALEMDTMTAASLSHQSDVEHLVEDAVMTRPLQTIDGEIPPGMSKRWTRKHRHSKQKPSVKAQKNPLNDVSLAPARWNLFDISHKSAPSVSTDYEYPHAESAGAGVDVYVLDTGIMLNHSQFGGRASWGRSFVNLSTDMNGHGTHVSGIIGGADYGVAPRANLIAIQVLDGKGSGAVSGIISGVQEVMSRHRAKNAGYGTMQAYRPSVINLSLKGAANTALDAAVTAAIAANIHVCAAAGNSNDDANAYSPGRVASILTVGASTISDMRANFSSFGPDVDIYAPGMTITSSWIGSI
ncbi:subtilisin-like serine protease [Tulasnella sp. JGI-2019a]|nr:subtilisin-like serine protease [Tulasnella sp. JGI-2019a]